MSAEVTRDGTEVTVTLPSGAVIIVDADKAGSPVWLSVPPSVSWQDALTLGLTIATVAGAASGLTSDAQIVAAMRVLQVSRAESEATGVLVHAALEAARAES